jgi:hypothetical protein
LCATRPSLLLAVHTLVHWLLLYPFSHWWIQSSSSTWEVIYYEIFTLPVSHYHFKENSVKQITYGFSDALLHQGFYGCCS